MRALQNVGSRLAGRLAIAGAASMLAVGCGSNGPTEPTNSAQTQPPNVIITVLDGDNQEVPAGQRFPQPVRVTVRVNDQPSSEAGFKFVEPAAPNGWISGGTADGEGIISLRPQVGNIPGAFTMTIYRSWCQGRLRPGAMLGSTPTCEGTWLQLGSVIVTGSIIDAS